ncbi:MAG: CDP-diacylglycerol--glycerol-3-phosphate 3-phosphatidyltransferase [Erysipelotrichaceae bacterium]|nr:CDP-diacylglycerol--glycerol-3-phosphate 3-phosphatidyltransferase [Erysipelotrichaceae bacterium]
MNLPTKITTARIVLVLALLAFWLTIDVLSETQGYVPLAYGPSGSINLVYLISCVVFIVASATDALDGYLARSRNEVTDLGKFLDPVADKLLVDSALIYLSLPRWGNFAIPLYCTIPMIARDLVVDALRFIAAGKGKVLAANVFGKLKTIFQMIALPVVFLNGWPFSYFDLGWNTNGRIAMILCDLALFFSLLSGVIYLVRNRFVFQEEEKHD